MSAPTRVLSNADRNRLTRLLGMLGSQFDAEVANAGRLADRLVRENGLTWFDVLATTALPGTRPQPDVDDDWARVEWRRAALWCLERGGR